MTLRTATCFGIVGLALPFAELPMQYVVATIAGRRTADIPTYWNGAALGQSYLEPLALLIFVVVLSRVSVGRTRPARLSDAAMLAAILVILSMALNLRWTTLARFYRPGLSIYGWLSTAYWVMGSLLQPVAWLAFLVTFVRLPEMPLAQNSRRAAARLALVILLGGAWVVWQFGQSVVLFWWNFQPQGGPNYYAWNGLLFETVNVLEFLLLLVFAVGAWRIRPKPEPAVAYSD